MRPQGPSAPSWGLAHLPITQQRALASHHRPHAGCAWHNERADGQRGADQLIQLSVTLDNAEARFAIGIFQALQENNSEPLLSLWISDVLSALHDARETKSEITEANKLDDSPEKLALEKAEKLTTNAERRLYLTSCWLEQLCTAEARVLGWVYQEVYGKPFTPG